MQIWINFGSGNDLVPSGNNADLSSKGIYGIHLRVISQKVLIKLICSIC